MYFCIELKKKKVTGFPVLFFINTEYQILTKFRKNKIIMNNYVV